MLPSHFFDRAALRLMTLCTVTMLSVSCTSMKDFSECAENADCRAAHGSLSYCADDGICEQMTRDQLQSPCNRNYGNLNTPDALPIGVILPTSGGMAGIANPVLQAMFLAVDDINAMGGINERPAVLVICDSAGDRNKARDAARYLIEELDIPAILGPFTATEAFALADLARTHKVPMITPSVTDVNMSNLNDGGYIWRTVATDDKQGRAMAQVVEHMIDTEIDKPVEDVRLALVVSNDIYSETLRRSFTERMISGEYLDFDTSPTGPRQVVTVTYGENVNLDNLGPTESTVFRDLAALDPAPDIVIWLGRPDLWVPMLAYDAMRLAADPDHKPFHLMPDLAKDIARAEVGKPEQEGRIWGTALQTNADAGYAPFQAFRSIYRDRWIYDPIEVQYASNAWDAVYALAIAARDTDLTGAGINQGLHRITGSEHTAEAVRSGLQRAYNHVAAGQKILLEGASGPISFDTSTGDIKADRDIILWCYYSSRHTELGSIYDGETFEPKSCMSLVATDEE